MQLANLTESRVSFQGDLRLGTEEELERALRGGRTVNSLMLLCGRAESVAALGQQTRPQRRLSPPGLFFPLGELFGHPVDGGIDKRLQ